MHATGRIFDDRQDRAPPVGAQAVPGAVKCAAGVPGCVPSACIRPAGILMIGADISASPPTIAASAALGDQIDFNDASAREMRDADGGSRR